FGETLGGGFVAGTKNRDFAYSWIGCGALATAWGLAPENAPTWYQFSSNHPIVQFANADGSVRGVRRSAVYASYIYASSWGEGFTYNPDDVGQ
ncbi:MAG: hypothetical protein NZO58_01560, partial [Gemmataceae bacterium]|nr:hypothetical protein [Gemmataceae bacterium]